MFDLPLPQLMSCRFLVSCWLESLHGLKLMLACIKKNLYRLHEQTYFFPPVKTKVNTEQNHPDLSISPLLYILKHRQMKEELDSNCIPHFLTLS